MIERISIENYKSIRELKDFELKPINVLIGANGSGKSNFLDVFAFLRDTLNDKTSQNNSPGYLFSALQKRGEKESICFFDSDTFEISIMTPTFDYSIQIGSQPPPYQHQFYIVDEKLRNTTTNQDFLKQKNKIVNVICEDGDREVTGNVKSGLAAILDNRKYVASSVFEFVAMLSKIKIYDRINTAPGSPVRTPQKPKGDTILDEDAGNLVDVLHQMVQSSEVFERQLERLLKVLFPDFKRISFPIEQGNI
ncbi:MAG: AAA family ATPase, partial [bacterium]